MDPTPVSQLNQETPKDFCIKVRALAKTPIKVHAKGQLFKTDFICCLDQKTTIEACFYTQETEKFFDKIEEGATYLVKECEISAANKRMTSIPHDFRLIIKLQTVFEKLEGATNQKAQ